MQFTAKHLPFRQAYLESTPDPAEAAARLCDVWQIGDTPEDADLGAQLILQGKKRTTSSLLWHYESTGEPRPEVGQLNLLEDGSGAPVAILETTWLAEIPLNAVDDLRFIVDYAEWGETAEDWQARAWAYYAPHCRALGREPTPAMPLLCERFEVVYPLTPHTSIP